MEKLRKGGINAEIYPDQDKVKKQVNYANRKEIPYVVLAGDSEIQQNKLTVKTMSSGEQIMVTTEELIKILSGH